MRASGIRAPLARVAVRFEQLAAAGVGGRLVAPTDTEYGLREGAHLDPDNNLLRFGSPLG